MAVGNSLNFLTSLVLINDFHFSIYVDGFPLLLRTGSSRKICIFLFSSHHDGIKFYTVLLNENQ